MAATLHIHPRLLETAATVRYEFDLVYSGSSRVETVFYEIDRETAPPRLDNFDGILCATVLHAMEERRDIRLHGPATSEIVRNLSEFQLAWSSLAAERLSAGGDRGRLGQQPPSLRDCRSLVGLFRRRRFDLHVAPQRSATATPRATASIRWCWCMDSTSPWPTRTRCRSSSIAPRRCALLSGARLCIVRTNSKELGLQKWEDSCGAQLAACLHLFSGDFSHALIGGSDAYDELWLPWGTNPVTDHLLSGGQMAIVHDGAAFCRTDKIAFLAGVPTALAR